MGGGAYIGIQRRGGSSGIDKSWGLDQWRILVLYIDNVTNLCIPNMYLYLYLGLYHIYVFHICMYPLYIALGSIFVWIFVCLKPISFGTDGPI